MKYGSRGCCHEDTLSFGEFLVNIDVMTEDQLISALDAQCLEPTLPLFKIALDKGFIDSAALEAFLEQKRLLQN